MSRSTEYLKSAAHCFAKADQSPAKEISRLWLIIGETYSYLADVENRETAARQDAAARENRSSTNQLATASTGSA